LFRKRVEFNLKGIAFASVPGVDLPEHERKADHVMGRKAGIISLEISIGSEDIVATK